MWLNDMYYGGEDPHVGKIRFLFEKYNQLSKEISDPDIIADQIKWKKLVKEHSHLEPIVEKYKEYKRVVDEISDARTFYRISWRRNSRRWWRPNWQTSGKEGRVGGG